MTSEGEFSFKAMDRTVAARSLNFCHDDGKDGI